MDLRAGLDDVEEKKFLILPGRYTDCAIPAPDVEDICEYSHGEQAEGTHNPQIVALQSVDGRRASNL
jgi:hypothetical protein